MLMHWINLTEQNRLTRSTGISLLLHLAIFAFIGSLLNASLIKPPALPAQKLEVRLSLPEQNTKDEKPAILSSIKPSTFAIPEHSKGNSKKKGSDQAQEAKADIKGIEMPSLIPLPIAGQSTSKSPLALLSHSNGDDAEKLYRQQMQEVQKRKHQYYQLQFMTEQLHQILHNLLNVKPEVPGKCLIVQSDTGTPRLKCNSGPLQETISVEQQNIVNLLTSMRESGRQISGFSNEGEPGKMQVRLIME